MSFKTTYILFGILAAELALFGGLLFWKKSADKEGYVFPSFHEKKNAAKTDDVDLIEIQVLRDRDGASRDDKIVLVRNGQEWRMQQPAVRVEGALVNQLINQLVSARKDENTELSPNLQLFGLEPPAAKVTLIHKKNEEDPNDKERQWTLGLGNESLGGGSAVVYATSSDRGGSKEPLAIPREQIEALFKPLHETASSGDKVATGPAPPVFKNINDFRSRTLLADNAMDMVEVSLQAPKHEPIVLEKPAGAGHWRFVKPAGYGEADDEATMTPFGQEAPRQAGVRGLLGAIAALRVQDKADFKAVDVNEAGLSQMGLATDSPETMRIEVKRHVAGFLGRDEDKAKTVTAALLIGKKADEKGEKYYARLANENSVVLVSAKDVKQIQEAIEKPETLRNHNLLQVKQREVDALDIEPSRGVILKLRRSGGTWKLFDGGSKGADADSASIQTLLLELAKPGLVMDFPRKTDAEAGITEPKAVVKLWVNGVEKSDDKPDAEPTLKDNNKPTAELTFGKQDGDKVYVRRKTEGGDDTLVVVPASVLTTVQRGRLAYLDLSLPSFPLEDVRKLVLVRDGGTYELVKDEKGDKIRPVWKIKQPGKLAGRDANALVLEVILRTLSNLRPDKLVAEKVNTESELDKYGLKKPTGSDQKSFLQATVTLQSGDKKPEERVYQFGLKDKTVYGRVKPDERGLVFVVREDVRKTLEEELRDPVVFHFDPRDVKQIKLVGWQTPARNKPKTFVLERKPDDKTWVEKTAEGIALVNSTVEKFVTDLSSLTTTKFEGGPEAKHKLSVKDEALEVEITSFSHSSDYEQALG
jgi:hypothetical protein